jgi:hypothetical protein
MQPLEELQREFPQADFTGPNITESDELFVTRQEHANGEQLCKDRAEEFLRWLMLTRKEKVRYSEELRPKIPLPELARPFLSLQSVAVVSHKHFIRYVLERTSQDPDLLRGMTNAEIRSAVVCPAAGVRAS